MTGIARKLQIGTAATAIALASVLTSAGVAQAGPAAPVPTVGIGSSICPTDSPDCDSPSVSSLSPSVFADSGISSIIQNQFIWIGPANPNPPPRTDFFGFTPLPLIPGFLQPLWGFFTQNLNFEICVAGFSARLGPYGSLSASVGSSC